MLKPTRLRQELNAIQNSSTSGIKVALLSPGNIFEWIASINGLPSSIWNDGIFTLFIKFPFQQVVLEPEISFCTIPFHPNVHPGNGKIQIDFDLIPKEDNYMLNVLEYIQNLLSTPVLENAINGSAKEMLLHLPFAYKRIVADCVFNSRKIKNEYSLKLESSQPNNKKTDESVVKFNTNLYQKSEKISFEKYHSDWNNIATCKVSCKK